MSIHDFTRRFFKVYKCVGCTKILDLDQNGALCTDCRIKWNLALQESCKRCLQSVSTCTCAPKSLEKAGAICHRKLFFYHADKAYTPQMRLLAENKYSGKRRVSEFLASQLTVAISCELEKNGGADNAVVTYIPRSKRSKSANGFDQSERLARAVGKLMGMECVRVFDTRLATKLQKNLNSRQRLENAKKNIVVKDGEAVSGKYVVLIDDMVTTGAGMSVCTKHLYECGALGVLCFSLTSENKM